MEGGSAVRRREGRPGQRAEGQLTFRKGKCPRGGLRAAGLGSLSLWGPSPRAWPGLAREPGNSESERQQQLL